MVKADQSYTPQQQVMMARYLARRAVKEALRDSGLRPGMIEPAAISRAATVG